MALDRRFGFVGAAAVLMRVLALALDWRFVLRELLPCAGAGAGWAFRFAGALDPRFVLRWIAVLVLPALVPCGCSCRC